jgi:hypothetical protein
MACAWDDSSGSLGVITEGYTADSTTHHLFAALSTRQPNDARAGGIAQRMVFDAATPAIAATLDRLNVAVCGFDADDRTAFWNDTYLRFFPEHVGFIHQGEPYRANLRRFYRVRLEAEELSLLERYVEEGVARSPDEQAPQAFSHRGFWLQAAEESGPEGRICVWTRTTSVVPVAVKDEIDGPGMVGLASGLDLFEHVGDGIMLTGPQGRIGWVNEAFVAMYRLPDKARAMQGDFIDVYLPPGAAPILPSARASSPGSCCSRRTCRLPARRSSCRCLAIAGCASSSSAGPTASAALRTSTSRCSGAAKSGSGAPRNVRASAPRDWLRSPPSSTTSSIAWRQAW